MISPRISCSELKRHGTMRRFFAHGVIKLRKLSNTPIGIKGESIMPLIATPPDYQYPWYAQLFFWNQKRRYGAVLESARLWARTPRVFAALALLYGTLDRRSSPIESTLRSLITVRVSQINGCHFCVDLNSFIVLRRGIDPDKLTALAEFDTSPLFSEREKAALSYAEAVTDSNGRVSPVHFEQLRRYFNDDAIIELTALIAFQNLSSKFNAALGVEPQGFCAVQKQR
jgi:AhpD family alkylhydroperoxidase